MDLYDKLKNNRKYKIADSGVKDQYTWMIIQTETHPNAYVGVKKDHPLFGLSYDELYEKSKDLDVHGGITYADNHVLYLKIERWWFGWDYAHYGDYMSYYDEYSSLYENNMKKWTVEEIKEDVFSVIEQLKKYEVDAE